MRLGAVVQIYHDYLGRLSSKVIWIFRNYFYFLFSENKKSVRAASLKDDELDENKDGVADVKQISKKELVSRKSMLFLKVKNFFFILLKQKYTRKTKYETIVVMLAR